MAVTVVIPARAGSKGIPGKNLWEHGGVSLLARAIRLGRHCSRVERVIVSTDDAGMQRIAFSEGAECPSLRPAELATDSATSAAVLSHVISESRVTSPHLVLLQVTSPLRRLQDMEDFLEGWLSSNAPACVSVTAHDEPRPEKLQRIVDGVLQPYSGAGYEGPRQALPQPYRFNGAFYGINRDVFVRERRFLPPGTGAFIMPAERSHNLDSSVDLHVLEAMLKCGHWHLENLDSCP